MKKVILTIFLLIFLFGCQDKGPCSEFDNEDMKDECLLNSSQENNDLTLCKKISNEYTKHECITNIAIKSFDTQLCTTDIDNPNYCISEIALLTNDIKTCSSIQDEFWKDACSKKIAEKLNMPELCINLTTEEDIDDCYLNIAVNFKNVSLCANMIQEYICNSPEDCFWKSDTKIKCYRDLSVIKNNLSLCGYINSDIGQRNNCIRSHAVRNNNLSLCNIIEIPVIMDRCINQVNAIEKINSQ